MNIFDMLQQISTEEGADALAAQISALYAPPQMGSPMQPQPMGDTAPAAPQMQGGVPATPPINPEAPPAVQTPQAQGPFTSPPGSQQTTQAGLPGTQSGPAVENPEAEKAQKEAALATLLSQAGGQMPMMGNDAPQIGQAPGGGPSLGSASPAQGFTATTPTPDNQYMMSLAQLLGG